MSNVTDFGVLYVLFVHSKYFFGNFWLSNRHTYVNIFIFCVLKKTDSLFAVSCRSVCSIQRQLFNLHLSDVTRTLGPFLLLLVRYHFPLSREVDKI